MKRGFLKFTSFLLALSFVLSLGAAFGPQTASAQTLTPEQKVVYDKCVADPGTYRGVNCMTLALGGTVQQSANINTTGDTCGIMNISQCLFDFLLLIPGYAATLTLKLAQWITYISGTVLNYSVQYTVVNMAQNIENMNAIDKAWQTIRDIGNMGFIFVLTYAAISTIVGSGSGNQKLIMKVVVVAILINFSLFFTRVIIDLSNVIAITFYDAIAPGALGASIDSGLSATLMAPLNLGSIFSVTGALGGEKLFIIGVAGTAFALIAAFTFFTMAVLLLIRFVILVFLMILSPIAFLAHILPQLESYGKDWRNALFGQAFFAPIFFVLLWVVIVISKNLLQGGNFADLAGKAGPNGSVVAPPIETIALIVNFILVIGMLIFALVTAKSWANRVPGGVSKLAGMASGAFYGGALGWAGRTTVGRAGNWAANQEKLQTAAKERTGFAGAASRLALYTSKKARSGTFDARNATVPTNALGDLVQGTAGRTAIGKKMGLDRTEFAPIEVGAYAAAATGAGSGVKDGFTERRNDKTKRLEADKKKTNEEYLRIKDQAEIKNNLESASRFDVLSKEEAELNAEEKAIRDAIAKGTATTAQRLRLTDIPNDKARVAAAKAPLQGSVDSLEKAINNASGKEIETIVKANRELLDKQEFANRLNVQQLEAINKSDEFSEDEKDKLKASRFKEINDAVAKGGAELDKIRPKIVALKDAELEMINPAHLQDQEFVSRLTPPQVESITKSSKFTASQQNKVRELRRKPLMDALNVSDASKVKAEIRRMNPKDVAGMSWVTTPAGASVLTHPLVLEAYTTNTLKRMGDTMNPGDIQKIREEILRTGKAAGASANLTKLAKWLGSDDGERFFS